MDGPRTDAFPPTAPPALTEGRPPRRPVVLGLVRALFTTAGLLGVYCLLPLDRPFTAGTLLLLGAGVVTVGLLVAWQVRSILRSKHPALRAVEGLALSLPLFLLLFAATYVVISASEPGAFTEPLSRVDGVYFVITVFSTVGFGDISAVSDVARVLVTVQMVGDLVVIGLVLRLFLTAVDRGRRRAAGREDSRPAGDDTPPAGRS